MLKPIAKACGALLLALLRAVPALLRDLMGLAAVGSIGYGAWLVYAPAGFITAGVLVLAGVLALSVRAPRAGG